jgi:hypothetical protein
MQPPLENSIREAVARGAFAEANRLLSGYCEQLRTAEELSQAKELFDWMLQRTSAARAHDAARLKELIVAMQYRRRPADRLHTWQIDG